MEFEILIAEDTPSIREHLSREFSDQGCSVITAVDGQEAIDVFDALGEGAVVLTDTGMPRKGGLQVLVQARKNRPDLLRVLMSTDMDDKLQARAGTIAKPALYLKKPFDVAAVTAEIRKLLNADD